MIFLYQSIYFLIWLFLFPLSLFFVKVRQGLIGRFGLVRRVRALPQGPWIWFHLASAGELEQCLPILDELKKIDGCPSLFVSYFSPTAKRALQLERARREKAQVAIPWDAADFSPFDFIFSARKVVRHLKPQVFVSIQREIWPGLLHSLSCEGVSCVLASTYWPEASKKRFWSVKLWMHFFKGIGTVDENSCRFLKSQMKLSEICQLGDPRIDRVVARRSLAMKTEPAWAGFFNSVTLVFSSLWEEDIRALRETVQALEVHPLKPRLLFVPHEIHTKVELPVKTRAWSHWIKSPDFDSHLIVDAVGFLAELYQVADLVFVGGSFKRRVHNVLEPAVYSKAILTGPLIQNSIEAMEMQKTGSGLFACANEAELKKTFIQFVDNPKEMALAGKNARAYIDARLGSSKKYAEWIMRFR